MAKVLLITGGARSGKSSFAEAQARSAGPRRAYIATAPVLDDEMAERVAKHRAVRAHDGWTTIEEQLDLPGALSRCGTYDAILVDCLTLWLGNLLHRSAATTEEEVAGLCDGLRDTCGGLSGTVVFVINEVGLGIVPDNPLARRFRDLSGRCSQSIAAWADQVVLVCCGLPLCLKNGGHHGVVEPDHRQD